MSTTKIALSPEEVDILIESLRTWGTPDMGCRAIDKAFATEAHALCDRLVAERRENRAHAEALADSDCPPDIILCAPTTTSSCAMCAVTTLTGTTPPLRVTAPPT